MSVGSPTGPDGLPGDPAAEAERLALQATRSAEARAQLSMQLDTLHGTPSLVCLHACLRLRWDTVMLHPLSMCIVKCEGVHDVRGREQDSSTRTFLGCVPSSCPAGHYRAAIVQACILRGGACWP